MESPAIRRQHRSRYDAHTPVATHPARTESFMPLDMSPIRCARFVRSGEPTLDQLFADPIVRQLMHRDGTDESATRRMLQQVAAGSSRARLKSAMGS